jgi:malate permease and related proteins
MQLFSATFQAVAILLAIGLLGFWLIRRRLLGEPCLGPLSALAIDIALPCLIFANIIGTFKPASSGIWWLLPLCWAGFTAAAFLLSMACASISAPATRREFIACLFYQNGIFLPLTIIVQVFGPESELLVGLFLFTLLYPAFFFTTAPVFFKAGVTFNLARVLNPVLISTIAAMAIKLAGLDIFIPAFIVAALKQVGAISIPLLMIIVGGSIFLDFKQPGRIRVLEVIKFVLLKNIIFPLATLGVLILIHPPYQIALLIMLQGAVPPITALPVFAERYQGDRGMVNQFMVASFFLSLLTVPATLMLFSLYFKLQ